MRTLVQVMKDAAAPVGDRLFVCTVHGPPSTPSEKSGSEFLLWNLPNSKVALKFGNWAATTCLLLLRILFILRFFAQYM